MDVASIIFTICALHSATSSGVIFGYPVLANALIKSGQYKNLCGGLTIPCNAQKVRFGLIYVVGNSCFFGSTFFHGLVLDSFGPKFDSVIATILICLGTLLTALSNSNHFDAFMAGCSLIGLGGAGVHLSFFHVANLFDNVPTMQSSVVGAVVGSALLYIIFAETIGHGINKTIVLGVHAAWLLAMVFVAYVIQPLKIFQRGQKVIAKGGCSYLIIDTDNEPLPEEDMSPNHNFLSSVDAQEGVENCTVTSLQEYASIPAVPAGSDKEQHECAAVHLVPIESEDLYNSFTTNRQLTLHANDVKLDVLDVQISGEIDEESSHPESLAWPNNLLDALHNRDCLLGIGFLMIHIFRFNFYTATILIHLSSFNSPHISVYIVVLFILIPGGFVFQPIVNCITDMWGVAGSFAVANWLGIFYGILHDIPNLPVQIVTFVIFSFHRMILFSAYYPYVSKVCGPKLFGRISGISLLVAGAVSALQYPLILLIEKYAHGNYFVVNLIVFPILPVFLIPFSYSVRRVYSMIDKPTP